MNIFKKLFRQEPEPTIKVQLVSSSTLTLDQWRKDQRLVSAAQKMAQGETFRMAMAVLENSHPRFFAFNLDRHPTTEDRAAMQAKCEGYQLCLNNLEALGKQSVPAKPLVATFEPPQNK